MAVLVVKINYGALQMDVNLVHCYFRRLASLRYIETAPSHADWNSAEQLERLGVFFANIFYHLHVVNEKVDGILNWSIVAACQQTANLCRVRVVAMICMRSMCLKTIVIPINFFRQFMVCSQVYYVGWVVTLSNLPCINNKKVKRLTLPGRQNQSQLTTFFAQATKLKTVGKYPVSVRNRVREGLCPKHPFSSAKLSRYSAIHILLIHNISPAVVRFRL